MVSSSRRLERVARSIQAVVGEVIQARLCDPRIRGMISVTRVEPTADLRQARVYLSIMGLEKKKQDLSLRGIRSAGGYIQSHLATRISMKTCPNLSFYIDDSLQKSFEIAQLIDQVAAERSAKENATDQADQTQVAESADEG